MKVTVTYGHRTHGFALPTVLIASVIMITVLVAAVSASSSVRVSLDSQYYDQLAREAAESGLARAKECLLNNNYSPQWVTNPLRPNTDCTGGAACTNASSCFVLSRTNARSTFSVPPPVINGGSSLTIAATGTVELTRTSTGEVWKTYSQSAVSNNLYNDLPQLAGGGGWQDWGHDGYLITALGQMYGVGDNSAEQVQTTASSYFNLPAQVDLPAGTKRILKAYSSGQGASFMCAIADDSQLYCRGNGTSGSGVGLTGTGWQRFAVPAGLTVTDASLNGYGTDSICALASDQQAYCAGGNDNGEAGGNTTASPIPVASPVKFMLSMVNSSLTVKKVVTKGEYACVIASDNNVYCAGKNTNGELGRGYTSAAGANAQTTVPALYQLPGGRKAKDVVMNYHDAQDIHVLATDGTIWNAGYNAYGDMAGTALNATATTPVQFTDTQWGNGGAIVSSYSSQCIDRPSGANANGTLMRMWDCNGGSAQTWRYGAINNTIVDPTSGRCLDRPGGANTNGTQPQLWDCNGSSNQTWVVSGQTIVDPTSGRCLERQSNGVTNGTPIDLYDCNGGVAQNWDIVYGPRAIRHPYSGRCWDVDGSSGFANGSRVWIWDCNSGQNQRWTVRNDGSIYFPTINRCLDVDGNGNGANGTHVQIWDCNGSVNQTFRVNADGSIIQPFSGRCIDVSGNGTANGTYLEIWDCYSNTAQKFFPDDTATTWQGMISGNNFLCALREDRGSGVWCAGTNTDGQLGNQIAGYGFQGGACQSTPATLNGTTYNFFNMQLPLGEQVDISKLTTNWQYQYNSLMVITKSGHVYGAGRNQYGKLGNGSLGDSANDYRSCLMTQFQLPAGVTAVDMTTLDEFTTYVLGSDGTVYTTGRNNLGQLGDGTTTDRLVPVKMKMPRANTYY